MAKLKKEKYLQTLFIFCFIILITAYAIQYIFDHFDEALIKGRAARERCKQVYDIHNLELGLCELIEKVIDKKV